MEASLNDLRRWFQEGQRQHSRWMIVVCDTFDYEDHPRYTDNAAECRQIASNPGPMQRAMEVYDLEQDPDEQLLSTVRAWNVPEAG